MSFVFHPDAEKEFKNAINYYDEIDHDLGYDFSLEVYAAIHRCTLFPKAWPIIEGSIRRSLVHRFPFGILYSEEKGDIVILAVMHLHRNPDYWKDRTK